MAINAEMAARMPWLQAEGESWWVVTGKVSEQHTVTECIAQVMPPMVTGVDGGDGLAVFQVHTWTDMVLMTADRITHASRLVFVLAEDPDLAYYTEEQDFLTAHHDRNSERHPIVVGRDHGTVPSTLYTRGSWPRCRCGFDPRDNAALEAHYRDHGFIEVDVRGRLTRRPV